LFRNYTPRTDIFVYLFGLNYTYNRDRNPEKKITGITIYHGTNSKFYDFIPNFEELTHITIIIRLKRVQDLFIGTVNNYLFIFL
jgi:hypothetical protein